MKKKETLYKKRNLFLAEGFADCNDVQGTMHQSDPATRADLLCPNHPKVTTHMDFLH